MRSRFLIPYRGVPLLLAFAFIVVWESAELWADLPRWLGWMPATVGAWARGDLIPLMVSCALAAYVSSGEHHDGLADLCEVAGRQGRERWSWQVGTLVTVNGLALLAPLVGAASITIAAGGAFPTPSVVPTVMLVVSVVAALAALTSVGWLVGCRLPRWASIPLALVLPYLWVVGASSVGAPGESGFAVTWWDNIDGAAVQVSALTLAWRTLTWVSVASLVLAVGVQLGRRSIVERGALLLASVLVLSILGVRIVPIDGATDPVCRSGTVMVCTPRHAEEGLNQYADDVEKLVGTLPVSLRPDLVVGTVDTSLLPEASFPVYVPSVSGASTDVAIGDSVALEAELGQAIFLGNCTDTTVGNEVAAAMTLWWWERGGKRVNALPAYKRFAPEDLNDEGRAALDRLLASSETARWLEQHSSDVRSCSVHLTDLP